MTKASGSGVAGGTGRAASAGEMGRARDLLDAVRTLRAIEGDGRPATRAERAALGRFGGFGALALRIFPDPVTGAYGSPSWRRLGEELRSLLTDEEYDSAKRSTFSAFYTSPPVMRAMFRALNRLRVPAGGLVLEPGCGNGRFMDHAPAAMRFLGVEMDSISGRIARARFAHHDIRVEDFRSSRIADESVDAAIGNPPFADLRVDYRGHRLSLHDYFIARSLDALKVGGVLALVTSHYTMDRVDAAARSLMAERADFLAAIRLPSDAFQAEGTEVVTDILFLRKRAAGAVAAHRGDWLTSGHLEIEGASVPINDYFLKNPSNVLGEWTRRDTLYGREDSYAVIGGGPKKLAARLDGFMPESWAYEGPTAAESVPADEPSPAAQVAARSPSRPSSGPVEGSFAVGDDGVIRQVIDGRLAPVVYGGTALRSDGGLVAVVGPVVMVPAADPDPVPAPADGPDPGHPRPRRIRHREHLEASGRHRQMVMAWG